MVETSARLLQLLSLFQGRRYWSGRDLAGRLDITTRTLRRDVDKLRSLGYPIHSTAGVEGGYQLGAGTTMPPLLLDDDEAVAVALGLRCAAAGGIEGIEESSVRALSKIEQILPPRLGRRVAALQAMIVTPDGTGCTSVDARVLSVIAGAVATRRSSASATAITPELPAPARSSHTAWSTPAAAGTSSPGTATARHGGPSAWTASSPVSPRAPLRSPRSTRPRSRRLRPARSVGSPHCRYPVKSWPPQNTTPKLRISSYNCLERSHS